MIWLVGGDVSMWGEEGEEHVALGLETKGIILFFLK